MSGQDNFVARWSRLKREAAEAKKDQATAAEPAPESRDPRAEQIPEAPGDAHPAPEPPPFDPATLPPVDSIVADSDIRAFLQKGVPAELTKAALRRMWTTDPAIRDFIGIAENQWDFTDPTGVPGFGPLEATEEVPRLVAQAMGKLPEVPDAVGLAEESRGATPGKEPIEPPAPPAKAADKADDQHTIEIAASQYSEPKSDVGVAPSRKGHGSALPR